MKKFLFFVLLINSFLLYSDIDEKLTWIKSVNWQENNIEIRVNTPLNHSTSTLASTRIKAENLVEENKTNIFFKNILDIQINSINNITEIININPSIYYKLENLGETLEPFQSNLSINLDYLETIYKMPIYPDFVSVFYNQTEHIKVLKKLDHIDYGKFTGLIIYVPNELELHGKNSKGALKKVLFPRIFNEDMDLIYDYRLVEPLYMEKWGMVIYGNSFNENIYQERIGITPLRIIARGLFGKNSSDIIISNEDANKIIGNIENIKIISQSRILILN